MAAGTTYEPIASQTLASSSSTVTFSNIPQTYTDLVLVATTVPYNNSEGNISIRFNSDTGGNYSNTWFVGDGSSVSSGNNTNATSAGIFYGNGLNNPIYPVSTINIFNYSNSNKYKTVLNRNNSAYSGNRWSALICSSWRNNNAITSITISVTYIYNIGVGSTFTLYGIKAA